MTTMRICDTCDASVPEQEEHTLRDCVRELKLELDEVARGQAGPAIVVRLRRIEELLGLHPQ